MTAAAAVGIILSQPEPLGYEVMIPRRIKPSEIVAVRHVAQKLGWRTIPGTQRDGIAERNAFDGVAGLGRSPARILEHAGDEAIATRGEGLRRHAWASLA